MYVEIEEILNSWKDANKYCDEYILTHKNDRDKIIKFISNYHSQIEEYQKALDETMSEKIDLEEENKKLQKENEELKDLKMRKDVVIDYIEKKEKDDDNWIGYELLIEPIRIKNILGGDE